MRALVLGGSGFLGRHVVTAMRARGTSVVIGSRHPSRHPRDSSDAPDGGEWRCARFERLLEAQDWLDLVDGCDVVVNCVGILRRRPGESYAAIHHLAPLALACACRELGVRLVHVSALGLDARARSRFIRSKRLGEQGITASGVVWTLVRPSLLDGDGGYGARWIRALAAMPWHFVPSCATGRIALLDVRDAAEAIATLSEELPDAGCRIAELGGLDSFTMAQYLSVLRRARGMSPARCSTVAMPVARLASHLCDALHVSPFSFGHLELMERDNVPAINALPALLGRAPRRIGVATAPIVAPVAVGRNVQAAG